MPQPRIGAFLAAAVPAGTHDRARNARQAVDSEDPLVEPLTGDDPREAGGYRLRGRLGSGAMGQVYLALTPGGRQVAVKMIRAEFGNDERFRARFRQEMAAAQQVHGLFTAQVLEAEPDAPRPWLATSYVPGLSLREAVTRYGPLPPDTVFLLLAGIAEALQAIHAAGIIHRNLNTSLLNRDCVLLAHVTLTLTAPGQLTMTWTPAGHQNALGTAVLTRS